MSKYSILIVDDHPAVREGLKVILSRLKGVTCSLCETVEQLSNMLSRGISHDLYILDLEFPQQDTFPIIESINQQLPDSKILIYSMHEDPWTLLHLEPYKIHGYVSKSDNLDTLLEAVSKIRDGFESFSEAYTKAKDKWNIKPEEGEVVLTEREKQVLLYLSKGYTTQEIADKLHISYFTAKTHRNHLAKKLHAKNVIEIVMKGKKYGGFN